MSTFVDVFLISWLHSGTSSPEWIGFREAEYKFFDHRSTWDQAQRICSWFDSSLASVHSAEEQTFLANTLRKARCSSSFTGTNLVQKNEMNCHCLGKQVKSSFIITESNHYTIYNYSYLYN